MAPTPSDPTTMSAGEVVMTALFFMALGMVVYLFFTTVIRETLKTVIDKHKERKTLKYWEVQDLTDKQFREMWDRMDLNRVS
jgi:hypothetical protein